MYKSGSPNIPGFVNFGKVTNGLRPTLTSLIGGAMRQVVGRKSEDAPLENATYFWKENRRTGTTTRIKF
jgi:hypothetical protein